MTKPGEKLIGVDEEQLRQQLRTERDSKEIKRLVAALEGCVESLDGGRMGR